MHNPSLQVSDEDLSESFQQILNLVKDQSLRRHAEKYFSTESFYDSLEEVSILMYLSLPDSAFFCKNQ